MKLTKEKALGCALRIVRQYVDSTARIDNDAVIYTHYRGDYQGGVAVRTERRLSLTKCFQLTRDMSR